MTDRQQAIAKAMQAAIDAQRNKRLAIAASKKLASYVGQSAQRKAA